MMDMLRRLRRAELGCTRLWPVLITGGDVETYANGHYRVAKRDLIVGLQSPLQRRGLQIAAGMKFGPVLAREMAEMRVKITASESEQENDKKNARFHGEKMRLKENLPPIPTAATFSGFFSFLSRPS